MPWQFGKIVRRPFQALFDSMEYHYKESERLYKDVHAQDPSKPREFDQDLWMREKTASRACFITGIAAMEAFANNLFRDFAVRSEKALPKTMLAKSQRGAFDWWPLAERVYFLPTLCNKDLSPPACYFKRDSPAFELFEELVKIRHSVMHSRPEKVMVLCRLKRDKVHIFNDDFPGNFWPLSKIPKDLTPFNHECAKTAYDNIREIRDLLFSFIERLTADYFKVEVVELISAVIAEKEASEDELLKNWEKYVRDPGSRS